MRRPSPNRVRRTPHRGAFRWLTCVAALSLAIAYLLSVWPTISVPGAGLRDGYVWFAAKPGDVGLEFPLWMAGVVVYPLLIMAWWRSIVPIPRGHCRNCRYDLAGVPEKDGAGRVCPECGTPTPTEPSHGKVWSRTIRALNWLGISLSLLGLLGYAGSFVGPYSRGWGNAWRAELGRGAFEISASIDPTRADETVLGPLLGSGWWWIPRAWFNNHLSRPPSATSEWLFRTGC